METTLSHYTLTHLHQERKRFRTNHSHGFYAKPSNNTDGSLNMSIWQCGIPGKPGTDWQDGLFTLRMNFPDGYPQKPPLVYFDPPIFHPNIYPNGQVCTSVLDENNWNPASASINQILVFVQALLTEANPSSPAHAEACAMFTLFPDQYVKKVREQAKKATPVYDDCIIINNVNE
jgi:ubiquitin-conjugating enzyme E2 I